MVEKPKVMIIDDEEMILKALGLTLKHAGFSALPYYDGASALADIVSIKPDLILLDLMMPEMSGEQVSCELIENEQYASVKHVPVIMLTAIDSDIRFKKLFLI